MKTLITFVVVLSICIITVLVIVRLIDRNTPRQVSQNGEIVITPVKENSRNFRSANPSFVSEDGSPDEAQKIKRVISRKTSNKDSVVKGRKFQPTAVPAK